MIPSSFEPIAAISAQGSVSYAPRLAAPSCGYGPLEVHPNKVPVESEGSVSLALNGEYLVVWGPGPKERFACCGVDKNIGPLECAEIAAALNNGSKPTRVVDACGAEYVSRYNEKMLKERAAQRGVSVPMLPDLAAALAAANG